MDSASATQVAADKSADAPATRIKARSESFSQRSDDSQTAAEYGSHAGMDCQGLYDMMSDSRI